MNSPVESSLRRFAIFKSPGRRQCIPGWLEIEAEAELRGERRPRGIVGVIAAGILAAERGVLQQEFRLLRSEEHTSELQSRLHLVCRLLLEKKKRTASVLKRLEHAAST